MQIKSKLFIIMISLVTAAVVVPSIIALNTFTRNLENEITEQLKINALNAMDKVSRLMFERIADTRFLTDPGNPVISGSNSNFTTQEKLEYLRKIEIANKAYASISLYDEHGIKIGDTRSLGLGVNDSQEPFYKNAYDAGIYYDQVPIYAKSLRQYVIHFSGPLYDIKSNQTSGVLVLTFPLNKINDIMLEAGGTISDDIDIDLLSNDGLLIYSNNDQKSILQKKIVGLEIFDRLRNSTNEIETAAVPGNDVGIQSNGGVGRTIFIGAKEPGFLDYKGNNWSLVLAANTEEAFRSVTLLRNQFIMIAATILILSIVAIFIFARSISIPIIKLRNITNEVSKGNFDARVEVQKGAGDELAQLSSSFENMRKTIVGKTREVLKANEELRQKDRLKDEFINVAAHELRTPIQPILGLCEALRTKIQRSNATTNLLHDEEQKLDIIVKNAKRLGRLAQEILDVTRIESKQFDLNLQRFDIVPVLSDFINDTKEQIGKEKKELNLVFEIEEGSSSTSNKNEIYVSADRDKIIQAISNLVGNAVKFTEHGTISVKIGINDKNRQEVIVSIRDTGIGIDSTIYHQLFMKFSSRSTGGIGLGLFITKNIVQAHGGKIWAENNADGRGATFYFTLPTLDPSS
jgi:signal transduction histidine kinase